MGFEHKFNSDGPSARDERERKKTIESGRVWFSFAAYVRSVMDHLRNCQVPVERGLSDQEFGEIERSFGFVFPPDVRSILAEGIPVGAGFPDWRSSATSGKYGLVRIMIDLPIATLIHEVAEGRLWWKDWPPRPSDTQEALRIAAMELSKAPLLIPIYSHCYMPCFPCLAGNPVLFLDGGDFFYCGYDVSDFFHRHAFLPRGDSTSAQPRGSRVGDRITRSLRSDSTEIDDESPGNYSVSCRKICEAEKECLLGKNTCDLISSYEHSRSANVLARFTMKVPPWAAKSPRRIEFWSDFVEKKQTMNIAVHTAADRVRWFPANNDEYDGKIINTKLAADCIKDVEWTLRNGGWRDEDICDIINPQDSSPSCNRPIRIGLHNQNVKEMLALRFEMLSGCLRKGGWSAQDIVECFN